jgi:molybdopterin-guanine dinucleotide biosynthesis protein A
MTTHLKVTAEFMSTAAGATELSGFVLAGGKSTRMGQDKALLNWYGVTLLDHMVELLRRVADPVQVVGRDPFPDRLPGLGPLSGIATGLETSSTDANLFVAVDLPLLTEDFLKFLRVRILASVHPLLACKIGSAFPLCLGVWRPMLPEITRCLSAGQLSIRGLIEGSNSENISEMDLHREGFDPGIFRNINTPGDYRELSRGLFEIETGGETQRHKDTEGQVKRRK